MSDGPQTPAPEGLTDEAASGLAYITIIPAIIFLLVPPYNQKPIIKFHSLQCLGLAVVWIVISMIRFMLIFIPVIGWMLRPFAWVCYLVIFILWLISMINAFQGKKFKVPVIGDFAEKTAGV